MLFDSKIRQELSRTFGATLVVILTVVLTVFLIRTIGEAAGGAVAPQDVVLLLGYVSIGYLPTVLSLSLFIAVVATLSRMYRDSEMVIWFASGVGLMRFVRPVLRASWPVLLVIGLGLTFVWPWVNKAGADLRERFEQRSDLSRVAPGMFQSSRDGSRVFFIERGEGEAEARNVFVLMQRGDRESVTTAAAGRVEFEGERRYLVLDHGQRNETDAATGERALASFDRYRILVNERAVQSAQDRSPRELPTTALLRDAQPRRQGELTWRLGMWLGAGNLLLLAVGFAATNPRRAANWNLLFALLAFVAYFNLISLTKAWVAAGRIGTGAALLGLHGTVFALALLLLWWRDHAATTPRRAALRRAAA